MPNSINIPTPPVLTGTQEAKLSQLHTYMFRFAEQLAMILNSIEAGGGSTAAATASAVTSSTDINMLREQMKQQLVNTASQLRNEIKDAAPRRGTVGLTAPLAGGAYEDIAVNFGEELPSIPVVAVSLVGTGADGAALGSVSACVIGGTVTTTGFTLRVANNSADTAAHDYSVAWIAAI